jgi:quercetin dioxygenase-like cupin family protein
MKSLFIGLLFFTSSAFGFYENHSHSIVKKDAIKWTTTNALPKGAEVAVIHGDPSKAEEFTLRLKLPANFAIAPHFHSGEEHVTVLEGTIHFGMGEKFDQKLFQTLNAGDFMVMKPGTKHFVHSMTPVIVQVHSVGPWTITYVNPSDDPRR